MMKSALILLIDKTLMSSQRIETLQNWGLFSSLYGICAGAGYNLSSHRPKLLTSPYVDSRVNSQHIYHGQLHARVDLNPMPESTLSTSLGLRIWTLFSVPVIP
jgi:hypothetical protein